MKFQVTKATQIYGLHGNKFKNLRLEPSGAYASGSTFEGHIRYLRLPKGFKEVVRIDKPGPRAYVSTMNVKAVNFSGAGGGTGNCGKHKELVCYYGCCGNDCCPKPEKVGANKGKTYSTKDDAPKSRASGENQRFGVQAGQVYQDGKSHNPYHLQAGEIEGVVETDSHYPENGEWVSAKGAKSGDCGTCSKSVNNCKSGCTCPDDVGYHTARCSPSASSVQQNGKTKKMSREMSNASDDKPKRERSTPPCDGNGSNTEACRGYCVIPGSCTSGSANIMNSNGKIQRVRIGNPLRSRPTKVESKSRATGDTDIFSVQPGQIAPFMKHNNPYAVSAVAIEGDDSTMPESYEY